MSPARPALTRRRFLGSALALPALGSLPAARWLRVQGAGERLRLGVIGTGGMGTWHLHGLMERRERDQVDVVRVCDVYRRRLNEAVRLIAGGEASGTLEYREVLDDPAVDAVLIATPDHWHTKIAIEAMEAGKDVYCEKPLSHTIEQALACRDAVRRTGRVLQVGPQGASDDRYWKAHEAIAAGRIGRVTWSQGSYCRNSRGGQFNWSIDADASPSLPPEAEGYVWWDRWLGHEWGLAPRIEWNPDHFFRFRKYFAYNGGLATDLLYHKLAPLLLAIRGPAGEYPARVSASGGRYLEKDERDIPDTFFMLADYPSEHTVVLASVMTNDVGLPDVIRGQHGTIELDRELTVREQGEWWPEFRRANAGLCVQSLRRDEAGVEQPEPPAGEASFQLHTSPRRDHMGNFLDALRGSAEPHCNVELGCATMVAIKMAVESYRRGQMLTWDADAERVQGA
jgi:predicted dehydrogenase